MNFKDKLIKFEKDKKEFEEKLNNLKEEAKFFGYSYDEDTKTFKLNDNEIVHVLDIYANCKTLCENSGFYCAYASLILIPDMLFDKIKDLLSKKDKESWEEAIQIINDFDESLLSDFYRCLDYSGVYDLLESMDVIFNKDDLGDSYIEREGVLKFYEECFFEEDDFEGYMSFFDLNKEAYIKNKHTEKFFNEKYLRDNSPLEYHKKDFYIN